MDARSVNINRTRPPKDCEDLALWLSQTVNDALRDCRERGLSDREAACVLLSLARGSSLAGCLTRIEVARILWLPVDKG